MLSVLAALTLLAVIAAPAAAAGQATLDGAARNPIGPIVVDQSGNGYVAWLHKPAVGRA